KRTISILEELERDGFQIHEYHDLYVGSEYLEACLRGDIDETMMVIMHCVDGTQLYKDKQSDCWIYIWIILELGPEIWYKKAHVLPGGFIPRPNKPKHFDSFMFPGFHHVAALKDEGLKIWDSCEDKMFTSCPFLYLGTADGLGSTHLSGLVGHHGGFPCCLFCRIKGHRKLNGGGHYLPALKHLNNYHLQGCEHPDIAVCM
ncbi:hypothetical protein K439DRAFT_1365092, partial [Ramaria rubella]